MNRGFERGHYPGMFHHVLQTTYAYNNVKEQGESGVAWLRVAYQTIDPAEMIENPEVGFLRSRDT